MSTHPLAGEGTLHCARCGGGVPVARALAADVAAASLPEAARCPECAEDWRLDGRFALLTVVGKGAVGLTWRARTLVPLNRDRAAPLAAGTVVAVKEMPFRATDADATRRLIAREARVLRELDHPAVPVWYADFIAGQGRHRAFYLVQAFIEGEDLHAEASHRRYRLDEVLALVDEVASILEYLHDLAPPVVHRDLKPRNLRRERGSNRLYLLDFGAVKDVVDDPATGGSTVAGTFGYMAPEQFAGDACPASDVYALGVVAVGLLARKAPEQLLRGHTLEWRPHVAVPAVVAELLTAMLEPEVRDRITDGRALRRRLAACRAALAAGEGDRAGGDRAGGSGLDLAKRGAVPAAPRRVVTGTVEPAVAGDHPLLRMPLVLTEEQRTRRKNMVLMMAFVGGSVGAPWWYLGHTFMGVVSLVFSWTLVPWLLSFVKMLRVRAMPDAEFDARYNQSALDLQRRLWVSAEVNRLNVAAARGEISGNELERQLVPLTRFLERPPVG